MEKVQITLRGEQVLVDADQVKKLLTKDKLVSEATVLRRNETPENLEKLKQVMSKIIRLNRTIRQNVIFL